MKKIEQRAVLCLVMAGLLLAGLLVFLFRYAVSGPRWASAPFNRHMYTNAGTLISGTVLDRDGDMLTTVDEQGIRIYPDGPIRRRSTLHVVGDPYGNISTGALTAFADRLTGYNLLNGAFSAKQGRALTLTVDADLNIAAWQALNGRKGTVAVYNYETGEILCLVSAPSFDPRDIPEDLESNPAYEGVYLNRFLSSTFTPGSIFKLVTLTAALEELSGVESRVWTCEGSIQIGDETIICSATHGEQTLTDALANSCNVVFGQLAAELGGDTLERYVRKAGLTDSYSVDGIPTAAGSVDLDDASDGEVAWAGVGQHRDLVNPCSMLVYMGAIANGGKAAIPRLLYHEGFTLPRNTGRLLSAHTADTVADMMANNVTAAYGASRFPGMEVCAKSGTAEVGGGQQPHAWFAGFLRNDPDHPYAFIVLVENGGGGSAVAGEVASAVLKDAVAE